MTHEQIAACNQALYIWEGGAINSAGIANALHHACAAWLHAGEGTDEANRNPAAILMVDQLNFLTGLPVKAQAIDVVSAAHDRCRRIVGRMDG